MRDFSNNSSHHLPGSNNERFPGHDFFSDLRCKFAVPPIEFPPEMFDLKVNSKEVFKDLSNYDSVLDYTVSPECLCRLEDNLNLEALIAWENLDEQGISSTKILEPSEVDPNLRYLFHGSNSDEKSLVDT